MRPHFRDQISSAAVVEAIRDDRYESVVIVRFVAKNSCPPRRLSAFPYSFSRHPKQGKV